ncbi:uncharacterized protein LOC131664086 [Phymastichus coffea]|uniref:uncharacterized protein LOC131664086 n=1 Tax=Phymastichus coffea TaxID=108790 RepID=UPI00273AD1E2|nr:uncharacterized protein LOC131664086 [Phymastichus coffea]
MAMSSIADIRPSLIIARTFGLAPYSITKSSVSVSKEAIIYSVPWFLLYLYALYDRIDVYSQGNKDVKFLVLAVTRTILTVGTLTVDMILCIARNSRLQSSLHFFRKYDLTVKINIRKNLRIHTWTIFCFLIIYFLAIGWFTYFYEPSKSLMAAFIYIYLYLPLSTATVKFLSSVTSIFLRFRHLNSLLVPGLSSILLEIDNKAKRFHLRDICWLHSCLCAAVEDVNSLYSAQLLLWFANFTFNTITLIHDFTDFEPKKIDDAAKFIRDGGLVILFSLLVSFMAAICHFTAAEANKVGATVFSPSSRYFRCWSNQGDKFAVGQYFSLHEVHFSAASGLFRINLSLLLKIAGAMTTYLVILKSPARS